MQKRVYDMRGNPTNISRLASFDSESFVHMTFYRLLIFTSIFYGFILLFSLSDPQLAPAAKLLTVVVWILFTPQVFETAKSFSLISSKGLALGHLSREYLGLVRTGTKIVSSALYSIFPFIVLAFWAAGFVAMVLWWSV